jgi:hypothetical protein
LVLSNKLTLDSFDSQSKYFAQQKKKLICSQCGFIPKNPTHYSKAVCWRNELCNKCFQKSPIMKRENRKKDQIYYQNNKNRINIRNRKYYQSHREEKKICDQIYRQKNKKIINMRHRKNYQDNKEGRKVSSQVYYRTNRNKIWMRTALYSHKKKRHEIHITRDELTSKVNTTTICRYCDITLKYKDRSKDDLRDAWATLDRVYNESILTKDNTQIICHRCNTTKGNLTHSKFVSRSEVITDKFGSNVLEILNLAKLNNGVLGENQTMLDENGRITFGYVNNNNQFVEVNIPLNTIEITNMTND